MKAANFGPTGRSVSRIGQGTWKLDSDAHGEALAALRAGLDAGMTHIDTAEMYGDAEPLVAEAIAGRRDSVFLVSKVLPSNATSAGTVAACERTLKRLRTDRLDCYLIHWRGVIPLSETIEGLERLVSSGKILSWGVSNFDVEDLDDAFALAGRGKIACNQVLYHLEERAIEHAVIPWCEANEVAVVAYSPFGSGDFPSPTSMEGRVLGAVADELETSPRAVALAFLARRASVFPIPKSGSVAHVKDNATAGNVELTSDHVARLDAAFRLGQRPKHLPVI